jgi:hypothetical protein
MNEQKLKKLLAAAGRLPAPEPPADFAGDVLRAARNSSPVPGTQGYSLFDQLNLLFPRVALAALAIILLCAAIEWTGNSSTTDEAGISNLAPALDTSEDM